MIGDFLPLNKFVARVHYLAQFTKKFSCLDKYDPFLFRMG